MKKLFFLPLLFVLSACAGPITVSPQGNNLELQQEIQRGRDLAYQRFITDRDRIFNITFPIMAANADFCRNKTSPTIGMTAWNIHSVTTAYRRAAIGLYNLQERLAVQSVADNSPAAVAGVTSGDFIVAVNGQSIPAGANALKTAAMVLKKSSYTPAELLLERKGNLIRAVVSPVTACNHPVVLDYDSASSSDINAFTDGERIVISKGIVRFAENDAEIALVIAHELGHIAMSHVNKKQQNAMAGTIGGLAIDSLLAAAGVSSGGQFTQMGQNLGAMSYSVPFEQEADYVGMYFMARAGYHTGRVADFWRRMAAENPRSIRQNGSHPTSPERFLAIDRTHAEITRKKSAGAALLPNFKER